MDINLIISICKRYNKMGWSVQEQLDQILEGAPLEDQNGNALEMIRRFLDFLPDCLEAIQLAEQIADFLHPDQAGTN